MVERRCCRSATWATGVHSSAGSPGLGYEDTYAPSCRAWTWVDLPHGAVQLSMMELSQTAVVFPCAARPPLALQFVLGFLLTLYLYSCKRTKYTMTTIKASVSPAGWKQNASPFPSPMGSRHKFAITVFTGLHIWIYLHFLKCTYEKLNGGLSLIYAWSMVDVWPLCG